MKTYLIITLLLTLTASQTVVCPQGKTYVKFSKMNGGKGANEEQFIVFDGNEKVYASPEFVPMELQTFEICLPSTANNQYTLEVIDTYGDSWYPGAWMMAQGIYGNAFFKTFMAESSSESSSSLPIPLR